MGRSGASTGPKRNRTGTLWLPMKKAATYRRICRRLSNAARYPPLMKTGGDTISLPWHYRQ